MNVRGPGETRGLVAYVSCLEAMGDGRIVDGVDGIDYDMADLVQASRAHGLECDVVAWDDDGVDWPRYALCVVRSTWNYFQDRDRFITWVQSVNNVSRVANHIEILRWNTDKHYLAEAVAAGLPIVPTTFIEPGDQAWHMRLDELLSLGDVVVKPAVSAGSNDTERHSSANTARAHIDSLLAARRSVMLQPYLADVDHLGETGLVFIDGEFSHAFGKGAILAAEKNMTGGLYAEEDITARVPSPAELDLGRRAVAWINSRFETPLYARIDLLPTANGPVIIELELTEPSLYLKLGERAATSMATAVARRLDV